MLLVLLFVFFVDEPPEDPKHIMKYFERSNGENMPIRLYRLVLDSIKINQLN